MMKVYLISLFTVILAGCATSARRDGLLQKGVASWYGKAHHGKKTASGEIFDMNKMTAAHRTLPFGTTILVKLAGSGRSVTVRINDRGPFSGRRIIDLSFAAAEQLGIVRAGEAVVEIYAH